MFYVAFIDILGYKNLVKNHINKEAELLRKLTNLFNEAYEINKIIFTKDVEILFISDSIFIFVNAENDNQYIKLLELIGYISVFQAICLLDDIYVRGGLSKGNHVHYKGNMPNMNIIVSQPLIDSVEIENNKAIYPKIIVNDKLIEEACKINYSLYPFLVFEKDNYFIDYYSGLFSICLNNNFNFDEIINRVYNFTEKNIGNNTDTKIKEKYIWVADYLQWNKLKSEETNPRRFKKFNYNGVRNGA